MKFINITDWAEVPGSNTYFRSSDVMPVLSGDTLTVYNSRGKRRSWGLPSVESRYQFLTDDCVMVRVTGWHKHTKKIADFYSYSK